MGRSRLEENRGFYGAAGRKISDERTKKRMTQEELGKRVSLTRTSIINIEKGRQQILLHTLAEIARALGVQPAELFPDNIGTEEGARPDAKVYLANNSRKVREWLQTGLDKVRERD